MLYTEMHWLLAAAAAGSAVLSTIVGASVLKPPVLPLAVRNPYLSTWMGDARESPWNKWPMFWTGEEVVFGIFKESCMLLTPLFT